MSRAIMQQALDALLDAQKQLTLEFTEPYIYQKEIAALKAELAKPEQSNYSDIVSDGGLDPRNKFDAPSRKPWQEQVGQCGVTK
jgi:hypothetical protein